MSMTITREDLHRLYVEHIESIEQKRIENLNFYVEKIKNEILSKNNNGKIMPTSVLFSITTSDKDYIINELHSIFVDSIITTETSPVDLVVINDITKNKKIKKVVIKVDWSCRW